MLRSVLFLVFLAASSALRADLWLVDYKEALAESKKTGHPMLLAFTGSWNACAKVDQEVFSTDDFKKYASKHYVLLRLDLSADPAFQPPGIAAQNAALQAKYGIVDLPSFVVLDPDERVSKAMTGAPEGGVKGFVDALKMVEGN